MFQKFFVDNENGKDTLAFKILDSDLNIIFGELIKAMEIRKRMPDKFPPPEPGKYISHLIGINGHFIIDSQQPK